VNRSAYKRGPGGRRCAHCGRDLPPTAFRRNPRLQDGLASWCRECQVAATRAWRAANAGEINKRKRATYAENRDAINARRRGAYNAARRERRAREVA
jgi:hypothetical protein